MRTPAIDFIGRSRLWAAISAGLMLVSLGALLFAGLELSIDFVGGSSFRLEGVRPDLTAAELREAASEAGATDVIPQVETSGEESVGALVRTEAFEPGSEEMNRITDALVAVADADEVQESFVGPSWGERITSQALQALVVFLVVIVLYISLRLEFKMALAAVVALAHDLLITIGLYALIGFSVSPATVIAILTILGYSLYDTVVVFDRVRENSIGLGEPGRRTYAELVNLSTNEVMWRSINTTITSLLPVGALLFLGAGLLGAATLRDLALALFIGMAVGVYSSLFVAGPFLVWLKGREPAEQRRVLKAAGTAGTPTDDRGVTPGSTEARAPITTEYVRGEGRRRRRRR